MRVIYFLSFFCISMILNGNVAFDNPRYLSQTVILKIKPEYASYCSEDEITHPEIKKILNSFGIESLSKKHPQSIPPLKTHNDQGIKLIDLSLIYKFKYTSNEDPKVIGSKMMSSGFFEYSEPYFLQQPLFNPNDPEIGSQYHHTNIKAFEAWDVAQGDTNIVMAITDTGIDLLHPDIAGNIKYNYADPINGIDDDNDGYIDNFHGWNTGENTNDPQINGSKHGQTVAGTAGAITNNGLYTAGVGYKSKILPIKISNAAGQLTGTYDAIVYAAEHGANIINCSWGSIGSWSQYGQDVITYATHTHNCLVVCAAGNDNTEDLWYPASFDWAMSVAATNISDNKWNYLSNKGSSYNYHVDISAPGHNIHTLTTVANGYTEGGKAGTSISAPIVSGAAAVAWSNYPSYTGMQIGELLKATADSLELIAGNEAYTGKLGEGRLNMERSVTESGFPGLYMYNFSYKGVNEAGLVPGDTVKISGDILNFLEASSPATTVRISTSSPHIKLIDSIVTIGSIANGSGIDLSSSPFLVEVLPTMPAKELVDFIFTMTDGSYNTKRFTQSTFNVDYVNVAVNKLATSVGASGKLGYNELNSQSDGLGISYDGSSSILYHMGLMIADNASQISYVLDGDFDTQQGITLTSPGFESDYDVHSYYNDDPAPNSLDVSVKQKTLAWTETKREKFVIVECEVFNNSASAYNNLHLGIYADWDVGVYNNNQANFDSTTNTAYINEIGGVYGGIHLLDETTTHHYAYNNDGTGGSAMIYDGYDENEQFTHLTGGNSRPASDVTDASHLIGNGPYTLASGDSMRFTFAILVGDSVEDIQNSALEADSAYSQIRDLNIEISAQNNPKCNGGCDGSITITASGGIGSTYSYLWNDPSAQTTATASGLCAGTYQCIVTDSIGSSSTIKNITISNPAPISVNLGNDTVICEVDSIMFDAGNLGNNYLWSTNDTSQQVQTNQAGTYSVIVTDSTGCEGKDTIELSINNNPTVSLGNDTVICASDTLLLDAGNAGNSYQWITSDTTQQIQISAQGMYSVIVTDIIGCKGNDSIQVFTNSNPTVYLGSDTSICKNENVTLDAGNTGLNFLWSSGATDQTATFGASGTHWVEVTDTLNCTTRDSLLLTVSTLGTVSLGNDTTICGGDSLELDAGPNTPHYLWSSGDTTQKITVKSAGVYAVKITDEIGCEEKDTIQVFTSLPPIVSLGNDTSLCKNSNITLDAGNPGLSFLWSTGGTSQSESFGTAGTHWVQVMNNNNCTTTDSLALAISTLSDVSLGNDTTICVGDSIQLNAGLSEVKYLWNTSDTTQKIFTKTPGAYAVTVTDVLGCEDKDTVQVSTSSYPSVSLGNDTALCKNSSITLDAGNTGMNFIWSTGTTNQTENFSTAGTYWVQVTNSNNCTTTDTLALDVSTLSAINLGNDLTICSGDSVQLDAGISSEKYLWNTADTTQQIYAKGQGLYSVIISDNIGCQEKDTIQVLNSSYPIVLIGNDTSICKGGNISLDAENSGLDFLWSSGATSQTETISASGVHWVEVTNATSCSTRDSLTLTVSTLNPVSLGNDLTICDADSVELDAGSSGQNYHWNNLSTTQKIFVKVAGTYSVGVTDSIGCEENDTIQIFTSAYPTVSIGNDTTSCNGASIVFDAGNAGLDFLWSSGGINQTEQFSTAGIHWVQVTNAANCAARDSVSLNVSTLNQIHLGNDTTICSVESLVLDAGNQGDKYLWNTQDTTQKISIKTPGMYTVVAMNDQGCEVTDSIQIFTNSSPTVSLGNDTTACNGTSITLDAGNTGLNFLWSSGGTNQTATFGSSGIYWVEVTNFSNCSARDSITLTTSSLTTINLGNDTSTCNSFNGVLDAGVAGFSYLWSTGSTGQKLPVTSGGSYWVQVDDNGNCPTSDTIMITVEQTPTIALGADTAVCQNNGFTLDAGAGAAYLWNTGQTTQQISPFTNGQYSVAVGVNCIVKDTINITFLESPVVWYTSTFSTERNSNEGDIILDFGNPAGGIYSGPGVNGNVFNTVASGDGLHKVDYTYTDPVSGCSSVTWVTIDVNPTVSVAKNSSNDLSVFPNPFEDEIKIRINAENRSKNLSFDLYDNAGKLIISQLSNMAENMSVASLKTGDISPGIYHLIISGSSFYRNFKLIK